MRKLSIFWRLVFWSALLCVSVLSLLPVEQLPGPQLWDKANHLVAYVGLAALFQFAYPAIPWSRQFALLFAYGVGIELAQAATGYRHASLGDLLANALGLLVFSGLRHALAPRVPG